MDDREQQRKIRHRLAVLRHAEEVSGSVAATCRYYGITRQTFYKWRRRFEDEGEDGLRDRSSAPLHSPNATKTEIVGKIIHLRQNYCDLRGSTHRPFRSRCIDREVLPWNGCRNVRRKRSSGCRRWGCRAG